MPKRSLIGFLMLSLLLVVAIAAAGCSARPAGRSAYGSEPAAKPRVAAAATAAPAADRGQLLGVGAAPAPGAPSAGSAPPADNALGPGGALSEASAEGRGGAPGEGVPLTRAERLVIKSAELDLLVPDTDAALDQTLAVASDVAGYVLNMLSWEEGTSKLAKVTLRVPADRYEEALRRLRRIGKVLKESSTGEDVSDEYVDLQSQLTNLEATAERLRGFLDKAATVKEALEVDQQLRLIEAEIEQVKGRLNYLGDRAAYSTISVYIHPERPTPTPTCTPTTTPTATPTPTPTPDIWNPGQTAGQASGVLVEIIKVLVDATIWIVIVVGPFALPLAALIWLFGWRTRRRGGPPGVAG